MANKAYFRVEHSSFNRGDWGYGRVANAAHYGHNLNKRGAVATVGLPLYPTSYDAERAFMALEEQNTRKNGRLGDTLVVCFPKEVVPEHRQLLMERLLWKVTLEGRTYAQAWEHVDKPDNPHFHVVLIDRDRLTGESVGKFGHSRSWRAKRGMEPNVTEWMRKQWEEAGNEIFAELGYELEFDRRSNLEQGLAEPGEHRGWDSQPEAGLEPGNDNAPPAEKDAVASGVEPDTLPKSEAELEDARSGEDEMAEEAVIESNFEELPSLAAQKVVMLYQSRANLAHLNHSRLMVLQAHQKYQQLVAQREHAEAEKTEYYSETSDLINKADYAGMRLEEHLNPDGSIKGFAVTIPKIKVFGREIGGKTLRTRKRVEAEQAKAAYEDLKPSAEYARAKRERLEAKVSGLSEQASEAEREAYMRQKELERMYCGDGEISEAEVAKTLNAAERTLRNTIASMARDVPLEYAREAFEGAEITPDEYETYLIEGGHREELEAFQLAHGMGNERGDDGEGYEP